MRNCTTQGNLPCLADLFSSGDHLLTDVSQRAPVPPAVFAIEGLRENEGSPHYIGSMATVTCPTHR